MRSRFLLIGTLVGGVLLTLLAWFTAMLPPHFRPFKDADAVVQTIRANTSGNDIYATPKGLFVSVALRPDLSNRLVSIGPHFAAQFIAELVVALCLSILLLALPIQSAVRCAGLFALLGLAAGIEVHFPEWNWTGFPTIYPLAGTIYLAFSWFVGGLILGALRRKYVK